jgi:hypothetical protein
MGWATPWAVFSQTLKLAALVKTENDHLCISPPPWPSIFSNVPGMTSNSMHMQLNLSSQSYGSFLKENIFFCYRTNSMPVLSVV